ncbi:MAG: cupredoxin domain-containing protein [Balneolales bacterium]
MRITKPIPSADIRLIIRPRSFLMVFILTLFAGGCGDSSTGADTNPNGHGNGHNDEEPGPHEVWMQNHAFTPSTRAVGAGTTITWRNQDNDTHSVTSGEVGDPDGLFDASVGPDGQFEFTFGDAGTYVYHCIPHPEMTGTITVDENNEGGSGGDGDDGGGY